MFRNHTPSRATQGLRLRLAAAGLAALTAVLASGPSASAAPSWSSSSFVVPLTSAEGIAAGAGYTFYQGELFTGDIYRGNIRSGTVSPFIDAPDGRMAVGMTTDIAHNLLFVAGGFTGQAYVYNTVTGADVATFQLAGAGTSVINDVALTTEGAWFTNSTEAALYFLPIGPGGQLGAVERLPITGPAADTRFEFNLNGIAASPDNKTLIVAHTGLGALYTVDPRTGASAPIVVDGVVEGAVAGADGILVQGHTVWVVQNPENKVSRLAANADFSAATIEAVNASSEFQSPATAALFGNTLAVVNAQFFSGVGTLFEIVRMPAR
jgi:sugar lactone lactonase YvrE